jgi:drug/metabolite transporter (DMT)-like permease
LFEKHLAKKCPNPKTEVTMRNSIPFWIVVSLSVVCAVADYWLKRASNLTHPLRSYAFASGVGLYAISAFGWVYIFRHFKLATVSAFFSLVVVVLLAITGVVAFRESLSASEIVGLICAVAALGLLGRFQ